MNVGVVVIAVSEGIKAIAVCVKASNIAGEIPNLTVTVLINGVADAGLFLIRVNRCVVIVAIDPRDKAVSIFVTTSNITGKVLRVAVTILIDVVADAGFGSIRVYAGVVVVTVCQAVEAIIVCVSAKDITEKIFDLAIAVLINGVADAGFFLVGVDRGVLIVAIDAGKEAILIVISTGQITRKVIDGTVAILIELVTNTGLFLIRMDRRIVVIAISVCSEAIAVGILQLVLDDWQAATQHSA
jgi:hypothetical protein